MSRKQFPLGFPVGLALLIVSSFAYRIVVGWVDVSETTETVVVTLAVWVFGLGVVMLVGSLFRLVFTEESDRRRRLGLLAGLFITLAAVLATVVIVLLADLNCAISPSHYEGWACRRGNVVYWPDLLPWIGITWIIALGLVWAVLPRRSPPEQHDIERHSE